MKIIVIFLLLEFIFRMWNKLIDSLMLCKYREEHKQDCEFFFHCPQYGKCKGCEYYGIN